MDVIAIDGPSSSGKSTIAKLVAEKLNISYINSGLFYRTITYLVVSKDESMVESNAFISDVLNSSEIVYDNEQIIVNGKNISKEVKSEALTKFLPKISENGIVRNKVNQLIREYAASNSIVIDGRDIGTVVFPDAILKIYLDADVEVRAKRRYEEVKADGFKYEDIYNSIINRDIVDKSREIAPLRCADDAVIINSTSLSIEKIVSLVVKEYEEVK